MHNCPPAAKWSIAVWDGADATAAADALATCGAGAVDAAYALDAQTGGWWRWFAGKPEVSNLPPLNDMQGVLALGAAATPTPTEAPPETPTATAAPGGPSPGLWRGTTSQGKAIRFQVVEGAGGSTTIGASYWYVEGTTSGGSACFNSLETTQYSSWPIVNNAFSVRESDFEISGTFDSPTTASGELKLFGVDCHAAPVSWTASAVSASAAARSPDAEGLGVAQAGSMHNCPAAERWSIAVWDGADGTAAADALATCGAGAVDAAYSLDAQTGGWSRWFAGKPEVSNLPPLADMTGVLALGAAAPPTPTPTPTPSPTPTPIPSPTPTTETGYLQPPQEVGHINASGNAVVATSNDTPYNLTVEFQGPTVQTVTIPRCDTCHEYSFTGPSFCPSGRPEETVTLAPGEYTVTARVDDPSVISFVGDWTLEEDTEYFQCFFIVTRFG